MTDWTKAEIAIIERHYKAGGCQGCIDAGLGRNRNSIKAKARHLGLSAPCKIRYPHNDFADEQIKRHYRQPPQRGALAKLAKRLERPRRWVTWRARQLGVLSPRHQDTRWSDDEIELLEQHAEKMPDVLYHIFKRAGYQRTATAIVVKRRQLRLRYPDGKYAAYPLADLFGVDGKTVINWINKGWLKAERRGTKLAEYGYDHWVIADKDVRQFIIDYTAHVDIRRVDKFWFVDLMSGTSKAKRAA